MLCYCHAIAFGATLALYSFGHCIIYIDKFHAAAQTTDPL